MRQRAQGYSDKVNPDFAKAPAVATREEHLLGLILLYPDYKKKVFEEGLVCADDFFTAFNRSVFEFYLDAYREGEDNPDVNSRFTSDEVGRIYKMRSARMSVDNGSDVLIESIELLKSAVERKRSESTSTVNALDDLLNSIRNKEKDGK